LLRLSLIFSLLLELNAITFRAFDLHRLLLPKFSAIFVDFSVIATREEFSGDGHCYRNAKALDNEELLLLLNAPHYHFF
jgi:hypothetical protein